MKVSVCPKTGRLPALALVLFSAFLSPVAQASSTLILSGGRIEVSLTWRNQYDGSTGAGIAQPINDVFGFFAFTDPANPEVFVKVLDFGSASPLLLFYGGLTDLEYRLTYHNRCTGQDVVLQKAAGTFDGGADNKSMMAGCPAGLAVPQDETAGSGLARTPNAASPILNLSKGRIEVSLTWRNQYSGVTGTGLATPINDNFGFLSFTDLLNPEVFVKVLDFGSSSPLLLFYGGMTDFEYEVTYHNICTNQSVVIKKPAGSFAGGADNRSMFAVCAEPPPSADLIAIRSVEAKCASLGSQALSHLDFVRAVAAYMRTLPEYVVSDVDEESLTAYGVFRDGRVHIVTENREFGPVSQVAFRQSPARGACATELPDSGYARLLQSFGNTAQTQQPLGEIASWLETPGGYVIRSGPAGEASLAVLRAVSGDGFFYFNTHGGRHYKTANKTGPRFYSLQSSTIVTPGTERQADIALDLAAGRLTYFTAPTGETVRDPVSGTEVRVRDTRYGVTGDFVKTYWSFAPNSIMFLNVCFSTYTASVEGAQDFIDACWSKGVGVYLGWSGSVTPEPGFTAVRYFVDRLVGANKFRKEDPNQRAFPWDLVYQDMQAKGLTHDKASDGTGYPTDLLAFPRPGGSPILLDPSIKELAVNEYDETLKLKGSFGSKKGKVLVGTLELACPTWASDEVVCTLPATGAGANGEVTVEASGEAGRTRKSNVKQLTEWEIPLHYLWTDAYGVTGFKFEGDGKLRFRADVGSYREKPHEPPVFPLRGMVATRDSSLSLTASGSHTEGACTSTLSGSGVYVSATNGAPRALQLFALAKVDANTPHLGALGLTLVFSTYPFKFTITGMGCGGTFDAVPTIGSLAGSIDFPSPVEGFPAASFPGLPLTWDGAFRIPATKFIDSTFGGVLTVEWKAAVAPKSPVTFDLAR